MSIWRIHREWGAVWIDIGRLRLIWCARHPSGKRTLNHPNKWMLVWRRGQPEWDRAGWERLRQLRLAIGHAEGDPDCDCAWCRLRRKEGVISANAWLLAGQRREGAKS